MIAPPRFRTAALIYNPFAGRRRRQRQRALGHAVDLLAACGVRATLFPTTGPGSAAALARREVAAGRDLIIVCGGDGTISEVVNGMAGSPVPLAVLPAGTGNVLAKELGLPLDILRAAEYIPRGVVRRIALGRARSPESGERYFISVAGAGADANLIYHLSERAKSRLGMLSYWLEGFAQLAFYDFREFDVQVDEREFRSVLLVVSRTRNYGGPIQITRRADLFGEDFEVAVFSRRFRLMYLVYLAAQWAEQLERFSGVQFLRARRVQAKPLRGHVYAQTDGELAGRLPTEFEVVPDALSLLVPPEIAPPGARE